MKTKQPKASKRKPAGQPRELSVTAGSPPWADSSRTPRLKGWYITRTKDGLISWRAWGNGAWWKQIKGGWIKWFDGEGAPINYDWQPSSRQNLALDSDQLPDLANNMLSDSHENLRKP